MATDNCRCLLELNKSPLWGFHIHRLSRVLITGPGTQSGEGGVKGTPPNNANHLLLSFSLASTYMIVVALRHLGEPAWLLTSINLFLQEEIDDW